MLETKIKKYFVVISLMRNLFFAAGFIYVFVILKKKVFTQHKVVVKNAEKLSRIPTIMQEIDQMLVYNRQPL